MGDDMVEIINDRSAKFTHEGLVLTKRTQGFFVLLPQGKARLSQESRKPTLQIPFQLGFKRGTKG